MAGRVPDRCPNPESLAFESRGMMGLRVAQVIRGSGFHELGPADWPR